MNQEIQGNKGQITQTGNIIVCHGGAECPMRMNAVPPSAQDEEAFYQATGIRVSPRVRALLEQFREEHNLTWRGRKSMQRMWQHRTLEYDDARDCLRLNPSLFLLATSWFYFAVCFFIVLVVVTAPAWGTWNGSTLDAIFLGTMVCAYLFGMWVMTEHGIFPQALARRLLKTTGDTDETPATVAPQ